MSAPTTPVLLFNDECAVCRKIGHWVRTSATAKSGASTLVVQPIGDDPEALRSLNPNLDIWDAYKTIHLLMPDGSMKVGGEAVAEVLRRLPNCKWFAWTFKIGVLRFRPFQLLLNLSYAILSDIRPLLGCESCGIPSPWVGAVGWIFGQTHRKSKEGTRAKGTTHFTTLAGRSPRLQPSPSS
jgi:predicted DCC family thiol-disulfide oxidoreductase YuxK